MTSPIITSSNSKFDRLAVHPATLIAMPFVLIGFGVFAFLPRMNMNGWLAIVALVAASAGIVAYLIAFIVKLGDNTRERHVTWFQGALVCTVILVLTILMALLAGPDYAGPPDTSKSTQSASPATTVGVTPTLTEEPSPTTQSAAPTTTASPTTTTEPKPTPTTTTTTKPTITTPKTTDKPPALVAPPVTSDTPPPPVVVPPQPVPPPVEPSYDNPPPFQ